jgi:hypothetical protein
MFLPFLQLPKTRVVDVAAVCNARTTWQESSLGSGGIVVVVCLQSDRLSVKCIRVQHQPKLGVLGGVDGDGNLARVIRTKTSMILS